MACESVDPFKQVTNDAAKKLIGIGEIAWARAILPINNNSNEEVVLSQEIRAMPQLRTEVHFPPTVFTHLRSRNMWVSINVETQKLN